jgi:hypothetical protein
VTAQAKLGLAQAHGAQGDNKRMVALLQEVAALPPADTHHGIMDASNTRNRAFELLGEYHMSKANWREALTWWERWEPTSWCGTCLQELQKKKQRNIARCREMIKQ